LRIQPGEENLSTFDLILRNGELIDGTGAPKRRVDVAIAGGKIAAILTPGDGQAARELDCSGQIVCPGFIDTHSHSDLKILVDPDLPMKVRQGVTLEVLGQDGLGVAPVREVDVPDLRRQLAGLDGDPPISWSWRHTGDYLRVIEETKTAPNAAYLVPHGTIRRYAMGMDDRPADEAELYSMTTLLEAGLQSGALGMSTGLIYPPCCYAPTEELVALGRVCAKFNAPLVVHIRSESDRILEGMLEMIEVGKQSGCPIHISHFKIAGRENWYKAQAIIGLIEQAQAQGVKITADQYPYIAGSTMFGAILPPWVHVGGHEKVLSRLRDHETREKIRQEMSNKEPVDWDNFWKWSGPEGILISDIPSGRNQDLVGLSVAKAAELRQKDPITFSLDLLLEEEMGVAMVSFSQSEEVVETFMKLPFVNGCTDGLLGKKPHPRAFGTFPRYLGKYARERSVLPMEALIQKLTSQAAEALLIKERGTIKEGFWADVVVFRPDTVKDTATFEEPNQFPIGVSHVLINGEVVVANEAPTGARPGRVVRAPWVA
jgi:N-acyl-D-amino-acid deacylase